MPTLTCASAGEGKTSSPILMASGLVLPLATGGKGREGNCFSLTPPHGRRGECGQSFCSHTPRPTPANRAGSIVLPRQGAGPAFQGAVAIVE